LIAGYNPAERIAVARQTLRHQLGIGGIRRFHCLCHRHVNKAVWKQAKEVTKKKLPDDEYFNPSANAAQGLSPDLRIIPSSTE
jgi:hypothetical protein